MLTARLCRLIIRKYVYYTYLVGEGEMLRMSDDMSSFFLIRLSYQQLFYEPVFSPGPFGIGGPLAFLVKNLFMWYWVWLKLFEVTTTPHPSP